MDFKNNEILIPVNQNQNRNRIDSGSESAFFGSWSSTSSSSFLTTSFGSELDSNETDRNEGDEEEKEEIEDDDNDEFIALLTRQMADYMLEEAEEEDNGGVIIQEAIENQKHQKQTRRSYADTVKKSIIGFQSEQSNTGDKQLPPPIQMYKVEDQPRLTGIQSGGGLGRKGKMSESTQPQQQHVRHHHRHVRGNKDYVNGGKGGFCNGGLGSVAVGSGMRAIFLGGSGSRNVTGGTGVFLPRSATDATDHSRKKTGCSTVLVPTRVLQALEQHFNNMESVSQSIKIPQPHNNHKVKKDKKQTCESVSVDHQEPKLPQEWIY
uniref:uncharacterized protein LOC122590782 isoform X2 n=1 Tax=Erigeron canadensis TaxID=72917 RepID=UPI001CB94EF7|nr:uncharacterized protein LOC122590782 isoform X2 [Erigeron canadensis]